MVPFFRHSSALIQVDRVKAPPKDQVPRSRYWPDGSDEVFVAGVSKDRAPPILPITLLAVDIFLRVALRRVFTVLELFLDYACSSNCIEGSSINQNISIKFNYYKQHYYVAL